MSDFEMVSKRLDWLHDAPVGTVVPERGIKDMIDEMQRICRIPGDLPDIVRKPAVRMDIGGMRWEALDYIAGLPVGDRYWVKVE